ncbi:MAG: type I phosphomannose isomerase catalytic subunit [Phycisphaeraceae bacterium]
MPADEPYPLKFEPIYKEKVWGGRRLERLGRQLPGDASTLIGESWEIADLGETSVSGGGGGAARSRICNGPLAGATLHDAVTRLGPALLGNLALTDTGDFPLLVKYLDAKENLSVQVHPSPQYAQAHPEAHLKSEAWYIVEAEPDAAIYKGLKEGTTPQKVRQAITTGTEADVEALLIRIPVKAGDCHYLPSGTCHALGAGVLVAEVQTPSDTTFRVYDWGRSGRELHVEPALESMTFGPADTRQYEKRTHIAGMFTTVSRLVQCEHFRIEKVRMSEGYEQEIPYDQPTVWMVLQGAGRMTPGNPSRAGRHAHSAEPLTFTKGDTLLLPASSKDAHVAFDADTIWLEVTFPQAQPTQIA